MMTRLPLHLETPRLALRPFRADDVQAAFGWFGDPAVMRFVPGAADASLEATRARLAAYETHQAQHGFSKWMVFERATGLPVGDSGLLLLDATGEMNADGEVDLGFRLARPFWGRGYATEVATAWVTLAFGELRLPRLTAFCHPDNAASLRVLRKLGMRSTGRIQAKGMQPETFVLEATKVERAR
ncbi:MAG TPA: GNAT family N-acetyltransferase [Polyangia bacterium]|jgi:RimJ/RimL family protein N-acetyltransferase